MNDVMSEYPPPSASAIEKMLMDEMNLKYENFRNDALLKEIIHEELERMGGVAGLGSMTGWLMITKKELTNNIILRIEAVFNKEKKRIDSKLFFTHCLTTTSI